MRFPRIATLVAGTALALALSGCITIVAPPAAVESELEPSKAPAPVAPAAPDIDDSAALEQLMFAVGGLFQYVETESVADCSFVAFTVGRMAESTPDPSYQGAYESIVSDMQDIAGLCSLDPTNDTALDVALTTRAEVADILTDQKYLGVAWGNPQPVRQP